MDTYEENSVTPEPVSDEAQQTEPAVQEPSECSDSFYHGVGAGSIESTAPVSAGPGESEPSFRNQEDQPAPLQKPKRPKRNMGKKLLKVSIASVLILALVFVGCGLSVAVMNRNWQIRDQLVIQNYQQQIDVLRQELEAAKNDSGQAPYVPAEGMTPSQIYEKNIQSVVAVNCTITTVSNGQAYEVQSAGSGFVFSSEGHIVTNHHVIENATKIAVIFADGSSLAARLIGADITNDIALLKVEATNLRPVTIGSSDALRVGDQVVAIGNALGELSFSLTAGYISGTDRNIATDGSVINMLQTDASINSGNSGGPLFNSKGEVVGITTAKYSGTTSSGASIEGIGFSIPMDDVLRMLQDLQQYGYITGAYLGVMVRDVPADVADAYGFPVGAYVQEVTAGYAAERAGLQAKDIITNVGGYEIQSMSDLTRALRKFEAGQKTTIKIWRSGRYLVLEIIFDEKPHN